MMGSVGGPGGRFLSLLAWSWSKSLRVMMKERARRE